MGTLHDDVFTLWQYLAKFFLEWETFQTKFVEKIKTHILCSVTFFRKSCRLWDNIEKCGGARQAAATRRMRVARWISKDTRVQVHLRARVPTPACAHPRAHTQKYEILLLHCNNGLLNASQCYVISTLPLILSFGTVHFQPTKCSNQRAFLASKRCEGKFLSPSRQKMKLQQNFYCKELSARSLLVNVLRWNQKTDPFHW
jgi:hypothetical protein